MLRLEELLFLSAPEIAVVSVDEHDEAIRIGIRSRAAGALCPGCGAWSRRVHGSYPPFPADMPSAGRRVVLCLQVRRFACAEPSCERRTFAEQVPGLTRRYSRWTERLRSALAEVGLALASRPAPVWQMSSGFRSAAAPCCGWSMLSRSHSRGLRG
ncbi:transposase family protein [Streptomyces sp. MS1.AVA.3]